MLGVTRGDGNESAIAAIEVPDAAPGMHRLCVALFEVGIRLAEYLHDIRRCDDGMRAIDCAWQIVCTAAVTDPKFVAGCLFRLGAAMLTCGCRPTAVARRGQTANREGHTFDQAVAELVARIAAAPAATAAPHDPRRPVARSPTLTW